MLSTLLFLLPSSTTGEVDRWFAGGGVFWILDKYIYNGDKNNFAYSLVGTDSDDSQGLKTPLVW